jgi:hypothetical protein
MHGVLIDLDGVIWRRTSGLMQYSTRSPICPTGGVESTSAGELILQPTVDGQ